MEDRPTQLLFSFGRLWTISRNTITEIVRQKYFYIMVIFGIVVLISANFFSQFSTQRLDHIKFIKDFGLAAIKIFGTIIAIVGTAQLLPLELENRTIYPILAKPVYRSEFLFGKYLGMVTLLLLTTLLMGFIFGGVLFYTEHQMIATIAHGEGVAGEVSTQEAAALILKQTRDPNLLVAIGLIYFQLALVSAVGLLIATFATSMIFNVIATVMVYIAGHLESLARHAWLGDISFLAMIMRLVSLLIPDLSAFDVVDQVVLGKQIAFVYVRATVGYGIFYSMVVLAVAWFIFDEKEI